MANEVKTKFIGDTTSQDRAVAKLQADLAKYQRQRERDEQALTRLIEKETESRYRIQVRNQQRATADILREMRKIEAEEKRIALQRSQAIRGGISAAAPYALGGLVGAGYLAQQAIEKAVEQSRANRLLASAATEAGVAQEKLAAANKRFADSVGLSTVAAATTTSQIQRLATYAGRPQDVDRLLKSFADLGAARGIGGSDLEGLIGTILSGQDEGLNRLGISDPGQLQKAYAASIGKTVEQLTQQEKVQAAVNAVMEKAAIFTGAAEARMNSLEGQIAKTSAQWENFTNALSTTFTTSGPVTDFLREVSSLVQGLSVDIDTVNRKLAEGKTPAQIAKETYSGPSAGDYLTALGTGAAGLPGILARTGIFGDTYRRAVNPNEIYNRRLSEYEAKIAAQQQSNQQQTRSAYDARVQDSIKTYESALQRMRDEVYGPKAVKKQFADAERQASLLLQKPNVTIPELQKGLKGIGGLGLSELDTLNLQQDYERKIAETRKHQAEEQKRQAEDLKKKLDELKKAREQAFDIVTSGKDNPFLKLLNDANQRMVALRETFKGLSPSAQLAATSALGTRSADDLAKLRLDTRVQALDLRTQGREFLQGYRNDLSDPRTVQRLFDERWSLLRNERNRTLADRSFINFAQNLDPRLLRYDQRSDVSSAFENEARRKDESERAALSFYTNMNAALVNGTLKVSLVDGEQVVRIVNEAPDSARVTARPTAADVQNRLN
jgi:hypothetical protein